MGAALSVPAPHSVSLEERGGVVFRGLDALSVATALTASSQGQRYPILQMKKLQLSRLGETGPGHCSHWE